MLYLPRKHSRTDYRKTHAIDQDSLLVASASVLFLALAAIGLARHLAAHQSIQFNNMSNHGWNAYFSGMTAGAAATAVGHPFDTVRIVMQTSSRPQLTSSQVHYLFFIGSCFAGS